MFRRPAAVLSVALLVCLVPAHASETGQVAHVVDGDTLKVAIGGRVESVRLIGVDTPETVHPTKPVEFFGKQASALSKGLADGKVVRIEAELQRTDRDRFTPGDRRTPETQKGKRRSRGAAADRTHSRQQERPTAFLLRHSP